jgi:hypothetical protein
MEFVRTKQEPDKESILTAYREATEAGQEAGDSTALQSFTADLARLGVQVAQEERFVIDLNLQPQDGQKAA